MLRLADLVETSDALAAERGRKVKVGRLAELLRRAGPREIPVVVSYLTGRLPQGRIGLGPAAVRQARPDGAAEEPSLSLADVDRTFTAIADTSGPGSVREKGRLLHELLSRGTAAEQRFLQHLVYGELRQGALEGLMADAIGAAARVPAAAVRRALMAEGALPEVAAAALADGEAGLARFRVQLFRPVRPMLATPVDGPEAAIDRLGDAALEYKLDGARIQVHRQGDEVRVYSRRLRDVTAAVPEVVDAALAVPAKELILDGEVLALRADGSPHPFQVTMRRFGRTTNVEELRGELPLSPFFFDLLHLDGGDLFDEPQARRSLALDELVPGSVRTPHASAGTADAIADFLDEALARGHEGVMAKSRDAAYAAGSRGFAWLKLKPAHTLDLVILAAEWGSGRRRGRLSNLHLGARDPEKGGFVMLGKTFKGLTDEMLAWQTEQLLAREIARDDYTVHVRPELVAEIAFSDVQTSPQYPGGVTLRFARVKRYRDDKTATEADTIDTVREIHRRATGGGS